MNNPSAFPGLHPSKECCYNDPGMTLRDYFAAHIMQGLVAEGDIETWPAAAHQAYVAADYMLEAREE